MFKFWSHYRILEYDTSFSNMFSKLYTCVLSCRAVAEAVCGNASRRPPENLYSDALLLGTRTLFGNFLGNNRPTLKKELFRNNRPTKELITINNHKHVSLPAKLREAPCRISADLYSSEQYFW